MTLALREGMIDATVLAGEGEGFLSQGITVSDPEAVGSFGKSRFVVSPTVAEFNRTIRTDHQKIGVVATPCQALALAKMRAQTVTTAGGGIEKLGLVIGLFCGWALSWRELTAVLKEKMDLAAITGMDIPPAVIIPSKCILKMRRSGFHSMRSLLASGKPVVRAAI